MDSGAHYPSLQDRHVFISGAATGIGAALLTHFAAQGSRVSFVDIDDGAAQTLCDQVQASTGRRPWYAHCDVRDASRYQSVIAKAIASQGPVRVLVSNAGRDDRHRMEDVSPAFWDDRLAVNLTHHFFATQAVAPGMAAAGGGSVILMGSVSWMRGRPQLVGYTTAKAAILGLTRTLARELGEREIRVNAVVPGAIVTERQATLHRSEDEDRRFLDAQCLKRRLDPGHVARLVLFLAADDSDGLTGQHVLVDAGLAQTSVMG